MFVFIIYKKMILFFISYNNSTKKKKEIRNLRIWRDPRDRKLKAEKNLESETLFQFEKNFLYQHP